LHTADVMSIDTMAFELLAPPPKHSILLVFGPTDIALNTNYSVNE
jgi:hypothetical protein